MASFPGLIKKKEIRMKQGIAAMAMKPETICRDRFGQFLA